MGRLIRLGRGGGGISAVSDERFDSAIDGSAMALGMSVTIALEDRPLEVGVGCYIGIFNNDCFYRLSVRQPLR